MSDRFEVLHHLIKQLGIVVIITALSVLRARRDIGEWTYAGLVIVAIGGKALELLRGTRWLTRGGGE